MCSTAYPLSSRASHAIGAEYNGKKIGSCIYSDITVFSFHPVKIITTGEGGAALTNDNELARKLDNIRSHGVVRNKDKLYNQQQPNSCASAFVQESESVLCVQLL